MSVSTIGKKFEVVPEAEYSVEFECVSKLVVYFKDQVGLSDADIKEKALRIADGAFGGGGSLTIERTSRDGSYALVALGVDSRSARVLGKPEFLRPHLTLIKGG